MEQSVLDVYDNPGEFFKDLATKVHKRDNIVTGVQDDGFVLKHSLGKVIFAGIGKTIRRMWLERCGLRRRQ